ncbi:unnamed protein product [Heligmosomoides polygyrus]|uniref:Major facilitator superfamily (MFS) profile domain-containing protein n=1 Tax=Heligmosomoides polygyrus TaxID=6339 RepID=A0A3P8ETL9_HELPZ|nr:unnamed protein product [Heligmosomoides polygyrus]
MVTTYCITVTHFFLRDAEGYIPFFSDVLLILPCVSESEYGGCDASRFSWCESTPHVNFWLYYVTLCFVFESTFAFSNVVLPTLFSKIIGPRRQGTMQGVFQMSGSLARMVQPVIINIIYAHWGPRGVWHLEIAQLGLTLALWVVFLKRLVPLEKREVDPKTDKKISTIS